MRINLTKKDIINSLYMQVGFSKKISENLLEDILNILTNNLMCVYNFTCVITNFM